VTEERIHHGGTETRRKLILEDLTQQLIGAAIEVHKHLGSGLLESAYEECLCHELTIRGIHFERQVSIPVEYKGIKLDCGYRVDLIVENTVILELKSVEKITSLDRAQLLTYLKLTGKKLGFILNFNCPVVSRDGLVRLVL
jgi:GxxExxY protein